MSSRFCKFILCLCQQFDCLLDVVDPDEVVLVEVVDLEGVVELCLSRRSLAQGGEEKEELVETSKFECE